MGDRRSSFELPLTSRDPAATVVSVTKQAGNVLRWTFSQPVISDGSPSTTLVDTTLSSSGVPSATVQAGANAVDCTYPAPPAVGHNWQFTSPPNHLTSPGGFGGNQAGVVT
jgi:hypothetical protein